MKPLIIGYFSINKDNTFQDDATSLKFIRSLEINSSQLLYLNVNGDIKNEINKITFENSQNIINLLNPTFGLTNVKNFININKTTVEKASPSFVCTKTTLSQLFSSNNLKITACLLSGVIYLMPHVTTEIKISNASELGLIFQKFMQMQTVVDSERFQCVYKGTVGKHTILYSSTMDGLYSKDKAIPQDIKDNKAKVVNLLKKAEIMDMHTLLDDAKKTEVRIQKLTEFALQAFLTNVSKIIIGYRSLGELYQVEQLNTTEVNTLIEKNNEKWLKQGDALLTQLKEKVLIENKNYFFSLENGELKDVTPQPDLSAALNKVSLNG